MVRTLEKRQWNEVTEIAEQRLGRLNRQRRIIQVCAWVYERSGRAKGCGAAGQMWGERSRNPGTLLRQDEERRDWHSPLAHGESCLACVPGC